jgi:hypothetical protein
MFGFLMDWWNSSGPQMQAAIIAALVSLLVSATTQFWSPISQRKIERSKIELQTELESTKAGLQKELEEIKSKFTIELESARDSISAKKLAIVRLTDARNRWSESAKGAPKTLGLIYVATVGMMGREDVQEAYAWVAKHSNECLKIFDEIRPLLDVGSAHQLGMKIAEFSDADEMVMSEPYAENQGLVDLGRKAIAAKYGFTVMLGTCISITLERLTRSRFSIQSLFADI